MINADEPGLAQFNLKNWALDKIALIFKIDDFGIGLASDTRILDSDANNFQDNSRSWLLTFQFIPTYWMHYYIEWNNIDRIILLNFYDHHNKFLCHQFGLPLLESMLIRNFLVSSQHRSIIENPSPGIPKRKKFKGLPPNTPFTPGT